MTDEQIIAIRKATKSSDFRPYSDSIAFARAILAEYLKGTNDLLP